MSSILTEALDKRSEDILGLLGRKPRSIGVELTTCCPLNCSYCKRKELDYKDRNLSMEEFEKLKDKLSGFERIVLCGLGEPTVYKHFYQVVNELEQKVVIITSGTILIDFSRLNESGNVEIILFSVDSPDEDGMKAIVGNYNWSNLLDNLKAVCKSPSIFRMINCTINENNLNRLPEIVEVAAKNRLQAVNFELPIEGRGENFVEKNKDRIDYYIEEAKRAASRNRIFMDSPYRLKCMIWDDMVPYITLKGDVHPCCIALNTGYKVGNIFEQDFDEIWESENYKKFREGQLCFDNCSVYKNKRNR
ncbi:radical SAM protein [Acetivibrio straminisolvens]|jgi:MoaA/NifB/PqqE/SkfB family radical SAM enzyme|uniref:Tungsten-containing aldehyde ferredoxin oxidoreductase cofactor modifying protein n=1 Tax=Acetivibrio straminisolvens JCM 21531 TaxID=1294263 RepID=W4V2Y1_9FIRM|nr:radical SAM protein [Acetivibrio straminisolvens]GAE87556.1 tungsten-containing aldehyde ferredoxin oxidoreductase cofactor modifying protein [Acetivibrio straminisolvens JCM 21531]